jgi:hypothetical protein
VEVYTTWKTVNLNDNIKTDQEEISVRFELFTAVTMENDVFWDVAQCGSCKVRRFIGT